MANLFDLALESQNQFDPHFPALLMNILGQNSMIIKAKLSGLQISDNMAIKFIAFFVWVIALCPLYGQSNWRLDLSSNAKSTDFGVIDDGVVAIQQPRWNLAI